MKHALLIGVGAEIGASLLALNDPTLSGFHISAAVNHMPDSYADDLNTTALESMLARLIFAQPHLANDFAIHPKQNAIDIRGFSTKFYWGKAETIDLSIFRKQYDLCIVATSKTHINDLDFMGRISKISKFTVGVSEASNLPSLYPNLQNLQSEWLPNKPVPLGNERIFSLGSCQSNGWQAQLRAFLEINEQDIFTSLDIKGLEVDIVHPDTPTGKLGTKSINPRDQDPRNNLRPSFSQITQAMDLLFPNSNNVNTISLRTLTQPPGYQISRFFFQYTLKPGRKIDYQTIYQSFCKTAKTHPDTLRISDMPLGSRAFEFSNSAAIVLGGPQYLRFFQDPFSLKDLHSVRLSELIVQGYVNNVRAYCKSVLNICSELLNGSPLQLFLSRGNTHDL